MLRDLLLLINIYIPSVLSYYKWVLRRRPWYLGYNSIFEFQRLANIGSYLPLISK